MPFLKHAASATALGLVLLLGPPARAAKPCIEAECGDIQIGRPKLWSLSDAQYLVGQALQKLRDLRVKLPENGELDPNKTHGRELDVMRQFIGVDVDYDQIIRTKNQLEMERYGEERQEVAAARQRIAEIDDELATLRSEKVAVDARVAAVGAEEAALTAWIGEIDKDIARLSGHQGGGGDAPPVDPPPDDPPSDETTTTEDSSPDADDQSRLDRLQDQRAELLEQKFKLVSESGKLKGEQAALASQITSLSAERPTLAETKASAPALSTPDPTIGDEHKALLETMLEKQGVKDALASRLTKILDGEAGLHYVHELDNLVDAQLQVISRRLSLLRQSVDPNYDLYFMETTASLTPTRQARRHVARARWRVSADEIDYDSILELYTEPEQLRSGKRSLREEITQTRQRIALLERCRDATVSRTDPQCMDIKTKAGGSGAFDKLKTARSQELKIWQAGSDTPTKELIDAIVKADVGRQEANDLRDKAMQVERQASNAEGVAVDSSEIERQLQQARLVNRRAYAEMGCFALRDLRNRQQQRRDSGAKNGDAAKKGDAAENGAGATEAAAANDSIHGRSLSACEELLTAGSSDSVESDAVADAAMLNVLEKRGVIEHILAAGVLAEAGEGLDVLNGDAQPYLFEMSPQQSELNIARNYAVSKRFVFNGVFKFLLGFGAATRLDRQRDRYGQRLEQRVFMAGYGKGNSTFGWDYGALPGEKWPANGAYTTYGVLAIPKFRRTLKVTVCESWMVQPHRFSSFYGTQHLPEEFCQDAETAWDHGGGRLNRRGAADGGRSELESGGTDPRVPSELKELTVKLPRTSDYWVTALYYEGVPQGEDISVVIRGKGFTRETTVLVNNTPLEPRWRVVDPETSDVSYLANGERTLGADAPKTVNHSRGERRVVGEYEVASSDAIILRFHCGDFVGIPQITLVSPQRSLHLNRLPMVIQG